MSLFRGRFQGDIKRSPDHMYCSLLTTAYSSAAFPMKNVRLAQWESACGQDLWLLPAHLISLSLTTATS